MHFKNDKANSEANTAQGASAAKAAQEHGKYSASDAVTSNTTPDDISVDPQKSAENERSLVQKTSEPSDGEQIDEE